MNEILLLRLIISFNNMKMHLHKAKNRSGLNTNFLLKIWSTKLNTYEIFGAILITSYDAENTHIMAICILMISHYELKFQIWGSVY
jgi:hypothetical protein